jgi:hypothetical protein
VYGSHDGGKTVHSDYKLFSKKFNTIFRRLNLRPHVVKDKILYGPGDIEGNKEKIEEKQELKQKQKHKTLQQNSKTNLKTLRTLGNGKLDGFSFFSLTRSFRTTNCI